MNKRYLTNRLRQLLANDMNARSVYSDLAQHLSEDHLKAQFQQLAKEEAVHVRLIQSLLELLQV